MKKDGVVYKEDLAHIIADTLGIRRLGRRGQGSKILNAILKAITDALVRGEEVHINGLGGFYIYERPERILKHGAMMGNYRTAHIRLVKTLPPKKYVLFKPTRSLRKLINGQS